MRSGSTPPIPRQPSATSPRSPATCLPTTPRAPAWARWTGPRSPARYSKVIRSGRWVAGRRTRLTAHFGALIVNLTDAVLPGREIPLEIDAFCGKLILAVPAGARVSDEGGALSAKRAVYGRPGPGGAAAPATR